MDIDQEEVEQTVLSLLYLISFKDKSGLRTWKGHGLAPRSVSEGSRKEIPKNHVLDLALRNRAHNMRVVMEVTGLRLHEEKASGWTTVAGAQLVQPCGHGFYYRAIGVIILESPNERAT